MRREERKRGRLRAETLSAWMASRSSFCVASMAILRAGATSSGLLAPRLLGCSAAFSRAPFGKHVMACAELRVGDWLCSLAHPSLPGRFFSSSWCMNRHPGSGTDLATVEAQCAWCLDAVLPRAAVLTFRQFTLRRFCWWSTPQGQCSARGLHITLWLSQTLAINPRLSRTPG